MSNLELLDKMLPLATPIQLNHIHNIHLHTDSRYQMFELGRVFEQILRDNKLTVEKAKEVLK